MRPDADDNLNLAAVLSSRICHDLVSPVGAIANGVDLIRELGASGLDDEFNMISQSAERASALLQFYRLAFGSASADAEAIAREVLRDRAVTMVTSPRVNLKWDDTTGPPVARPEARLLCQLVLCARSVTGMSGMVEVALPRDGTMPMSIHIHGDGASDAADRLAFLTGGAQPQDVSARTIEFAMARNSAAALGAKVQVVRSVGITDLLVQQI